MAHNKKRKAEANELDEMDRQLYTTFRTAANSISSLYTSSLNLQKRAFNSGARHTTEKLLQWALSQREGGEGVVNLPDLVNALQVGRDRERDAPFSIAPMFPRSPTRRYPPNGAPQSFNSLTTYPPTPPPKLVSKFSWKIYSRHKKVENCCGCVRARTLG